MKIRPTHLRRLAVVVALVVTYFLTWGPTKRHAQFLTLNSENNLRVVNASGSPAPLIVYCDEYTANSSTKVLEVKRRYYLWFFGPMIPSASPEEARLVLLVAIFLISTLGFAWSTNRIHIGGVGVSIVLLLSIALLILLLQPRG